MSNDLGKILCKIALLIEREHEYTHNIISYYIRHLASKYGPSEANSIVTAFKLDLLYEIHPIKISDKCLIMEGILSQLKQEHEVNFVHFNETEDVWISYNEYIINIHNTVLTITWEVTERLKSHSKQVFSIEISEPDAIEKTAKYFNQLIK